jgi:4-cresol dehydrogenase (hydroxylating)
MVFAADLQGLRMAQSDNFAAALQQWQHLLGAEQVITHNEQTRLAATATFLTTSQVLAILRPDKSELAACLQIATDFGIAVYPVSSGKNWGYGSRVPSCRQAVLIDLIRLKKISDYQPQQHVIRVEAGVTQQELAEYLQRAGGTDWMDCTGSHPDCSIVGNTVERGFGHTPYGEHANFIAGLEVMLADGSIIQTGFHRFDNARAAGLYKWGLGPGLDQLFLQSNLGIVLSMTLWLMPKPEKFIAFYLSAKTDAALEAIVSALTPLKQQGIITSLPHIANEFRVLGGMQQYPWQRAQELKQTGFPLPAALKAELQQKWQVGNWNVSGALYGTREQVANAKRQVRRALSKVPAARLNFISDELLCFIERYQKLIAWITRMDIPGMLKVLRPVHNMMKGLPSSQFLSSAYWRKQHKASADFDLDRDGVGLIWCAFVGPATAAAARELMNIISDVLTRHGFEPGVTFTLLNERCLDAVISLLFDRQAMAPDGQSWDDKALACRQELYQQMFRHGFYPYRVDVDMMKLLNTTGDASYLELLQRLKSCLDPAGILAPGRYIAESMQELSE